MIESCGIRLDFGGTEGFLSPAEVDAMAPQVARAADTRSCSDVREAADQVMWAALT